MKTQLQRVTEILQRDGKISRNQCLSMFPAITRLGARIIDLRNMGWQFHTVAEDGDYFYVVTKSPAPKQLELI